MPPASTTRIASRTRKRPTLFPHPNLWIVDEQSLHTPSSPLARAWKGFLNVSLVLVLVVIASLIGVGGASLFIYRQMSKEVTVTKGNAGKGQSFSPDADASHPKLAVVPPMEPGVQHAVIPTVADSGEWHFAEFSDQPRYIDVTYDGGRQHARLKVNTVLSPELASASSSVTNDENPDEGDNTIQLSDPGSHYILNKDGRVVGVDGSAGAALEVRRAQAIPSQASAPTIRNPVPEVRVASPVLQYGRPLFESDQPVQATIPNSPYLPVRRALPVNPGAAANGGSTFNASSEVADDGQPVQRAQPVSRDPRAPHDDRTFQLPDNTSVFQRNR